MRGSQSHPKAPMNHAPVRQVAHDIAEPCAMVDDCVQQRCAAVKVGSSKRVREEAGHLVPVHNAVL
jgi:hypothetical protein